MRRSSRYCMSFAAICCLIAVIALIPSFATAQEPFRNPAIEEQDEFGMVFARARRLMRERRFDEAIKELQAAARLRNGDCAQCFELIGQTYMQIPRLKEAADAFRKAVALKPSNEAELQNWLGVALYQQNEKSLYDEAAAAFRRAIELTGGKLTRAYYNLGYTLIKQGKEEEGKAALRAYLEADPSAPDARGVRAVLENPELVNVAMAPDFKVVALDGQELSLEKYSGRVVLLDFWATWCGPCIAEMPSVKKLYQKYSKDGFIIIGVSLDDDYLKLQNYLRKEAIGWPQYFDESGHLARLYRVKAIPYTVLIDHDGVIRAQGLRGGSLSSKVGDLIKKMKKAQGVD
ncbi:MAG TPA: redoxin domain-containing protein [Blastocatellia bacterium]|nr:redoxin domain-containing protein [Blastocatellia bacterium]